MEPLRSINSTKMGVFPILCVLLVSVLLTSSKLVSAAGRRNSSLIRQPAGPCFSCPSWRLGVETNNIRDWATVPQICGLYVAGYILGNQYLDDSKAVTEEAFMYAEKLARPGDDKDVWIFDVDETALSHVQFYARYGFGTHQFPRMEFMNFLNEGISPVLPESLKLYKELLELGFKVVFLTGRPEEMRNSTENNLKNAGYHTWEKLILRNSNEWNLTQKEYKSGARSRLVESGHRILGNMGDQWSDLLGDNPGNRTFKLPNPMYYAQ